MELTRGAAGGRLVWAGISGRGGRSRNEDAWGAVRLSGGGGLLVVADGLGGQADGRIAARTAVRAALAVARADRTGAPDQLAQSASRAAAEAVAGARASRGTNLASTLALAVWRDGVCAWRHCGDSRIYDLSSGTPQRLTIDHSLAMAQIPEADRPTVDVRGDPRRNTLIASLGEVDPIIDEGAAPMPAPRLALCSDGVWEAVGEAGLSTLAWGERPGTAIRHLTAPLRARRDPEQDNFTLLIARQGTWLESLGS
jgi:serine/threonine protein phosphatase PrpC